jgi:hypothetical protein
MVGMRLALMDLRTLTAASLTALLLLSVSGDSFSEGLSSTEASSAQRKKVRAKKPAPAPQPYRWRPADPSFDQNGRLYKPPPGLPCPVDLGYGRWTSCLWDD